jgi:putative membrane protein
VLYLKALHIIFVVTWFAGIFYVVRLFVYHAEAAAKPEPERSILSGHFKGAERRLWYGITWPSAILTWLFGIWLLIKMFGDNIPDWLWVKLAFVAGFTLYHLVCGRMFRAFQKDIIPFTGAQLRVWNEVATLFLFTIVFIVVVRDTTQWLTGLAGLVLLSLLLFLGIKIYRRIREKQQ